MNRNARLRFGRPHRARATARASVGAALAASAALVLAGCSRFAPATQTLRIETDPPEAELIVNGRPAGLSPTGVEIRRDELAAVTARKPGYVPATATTTRRLSRTGKLDAAGGIFILPLFGLGAPGAWRQEPETLRIVLPEVGAAER